LVVSKSYQIKDVTMQLLSKEEDGLVRSLNSITCVKIKHIYVEVKNKFIIKKQFFKVFRMSVQKNLGIKF